MDKFVVRTPRNLCSVPPSTKPNKHLTQSTIESLPGVVVIEDVTRLRSILQLEDHNKGILLQSLEELNKKIPSRSMLNSTKIDHAVNRLTKHSDGEVAAKAKSLIKKWKHYFKEKLDCPLLEVKFDHKTEGLRNAARKHLAAALQSSTGDDLVKVIEQEAFHQHRRLVGAPYRRTVRKIIFALKYQPELRNSVISRTLATSELVRQYNQESKIS